MRLQLRREAETEIDEAEAYLDLQSAGLGGRFIDELESVFESITAHPEGFPKLETLPRGSPYQRAILRQFHYVVVFERLEHKVLIVAVAHTSRRPNYWIGRTDH